MELMPPISSKQLNVTDITLNVKTLNELYKERCTCELCADCCGTSMVDAKERDDTFLAPCSTCGESGFVSTCARCQAINALLAEQEEPAMAA